jgi:glutamine synthetase
MNAAADKCLTHYLVTDLGGITRGRGAWSGVEAPLKRSVGWVPVNQVITPFDTIASPNPWGSHGDCWLYPDPSTLVEVSLPDGLRTRLCLSNIGDAQGKPLEMCPRSFLADAVAQLAAHGLQVMASFEQEFWLPPSAGQGGAACGYPGFSYQSAVANGRFSQQLMAVLEQAGVEPEMFLPEFGRDQCELTLSPAFGVVAADRAVVSRELTRACAAAMGRHASFTPLRSPGSIGSGVHVHLSLWTCDGRPVSFDPAGPANMSATLSHFAAGIVAHMPALCALTAPSVVSYERLQPHRWSSAYTCMGDRNREATLRLCPLQDGPLESQQRQFNIEYRAADATANPYLVLGSLIRAGLDGLERALPPPPLVNEDPSELPQDALDKRGIRRLPQSLEEALAALQSDAIAAAWLPAGLLEAYVLEKNAERLACEGLDAAAICDRYAAVF